MPTIKDHIMKMSAEKFVENALPYLEMLRVWSLTKDVSPFVKSAIIILEVVIEHPETETLLIEALKNVPGFAGSNSNAVAEGLEAYADMQSELFEVSKNLIEE